MHNLMQSKTNINKQKIATTEIKQHISRHQQTTKTRAKVHSAKKLIAQSYSPKRWRYDA